jgi:hypothetical protein
MLINSILKAIKHKNTTILGIALLNIIKILYFKIKVLDTNYNKVD